MTEYSAIDQPPVTDSEAQRSAADPAADSASPAYDDPDFAARYGVKHGMSRTRKITLGVAGLCVLGGVAAYIGWNEAHPKVQATVLSYTTQGNSVSVKFEVDKPSDEMLECTLEAVDVKGEVIGSANVAVDPGRSKEILLSTVNATGTPNTVEVASCVKG